MSDPGQIALQHLVQQTQSLLDGDQSRTWKFKPIPFRQFAVEHARVRLTDRQMADAIRLLGEDPERTFENGSPYTTFVLIASKGSGKDFLAMVIMMYCFYLLLCMQSPRDYFGMPITESIDMLIISYTEEQARDITFGKFRQLLLHWAWLRQNFDVIVGEKYVTKKRGLPVILILTDKVTAPTPNVQIKAEHSMNEGFEGYNPLFWAMSEASAFVTRHRARNGAKVYNTLRTSASSRYGNRWKGMAYSFLRDDALTDFTWLLYEEAERSPEMCRDLALAWEFKPREKFSRETFDFSCEVEVRDGDGYRVETRTYKVPVVPYQDEALTIPDFFKKSALCIIPRTGERAASTELILGAIHSFKPLVEFGNRTEATDDGDLKIVCDLVGLEENKARFVWDYLITVDLGEKESASAIAIQHREQEKGYVLDAVIAWTPIERKPPEQPVAIPVNMEDVFKKLLILAKALNNATVGFDQWQSVLYAAQLASEGIKTEEYHKSRGRNYRIFRTAMSARMAWLVNDAELLRQWNALVLDKDDVQLNERISRRKDLVDAVVGGYMILMKDFKTAPMGIPGGMTVSNNLIQQGGLLIPEAP